MIILNDYNYFYEQRAAAEKFEKEKIRRIGIAVGITVLVSIGIQNLAALILYIPLLSEVYFSSPNFQNAFTMLISIFGIAAPFAVCGIYLERTTKTEVFKFNMPKKKSLAVLAVPFGFFICLAANYVSGIFLNLFSGAGIELTAPENNIPSGLIGRIIYAVTVAVVPALCEEAAIRGAVMQPLRKYGDTFAIVMSSFVFAMLHGNLVQAPFALIVGMAIGYTVCLTESLWTGIAIHFVNNLYSVFAAILFEDITDEATLNAVFNIMLLVLYAVTIVGSVGFVIVRGKMRLEKKYTFLSGGRKAAAFILNIAMIISIIIMIKITSTYIELG